MKITTQWLFISLFILAISGLDIKTSSASSDVDSVLKIISKEKNSVEKVNNLLFLTREYYLADPDSAMLFCQQAYDLSNNLKYEEGQAKALYWKCILYKARGDYDTAMQIITNYLALDILKQDSIMMAKGYSQYGKLLRSQGKMESSLSYYRKALKIFLRNLDTAALISIYNSFGIIFQELAEYDSSALYLQKTITLSEKSGRTRYLSLVYSNLGETYLRMGQSDNAKRYLHKSAVHARSSGHDKSLAIIYTKLGNVASAEQELDTVIYYYKKAEELYREIKDQRGINDLYVNYGIVFQQNGLYDLAIENYDMALSYYKAQNYTRGIIIALQNKASILAEQGKHNQALVLFDSCKQLALETRDKENLKKLLLHISNTYYQVGDYKKALEYYYQYDTVKYDIYDLNKERVVADLRFQYEREADQAKLLVQKNEILRKTTQRNIYFFTGLGIIALSIFLIIVIRLTARKNRIISEQKIRQLEEEKKLLAARFLVEGQEEERKRIATELHDGLGVLLSATKLQFTSIKDPTPANKPLIEKATQFLEQATSDVRKISHNMMPGLLTKLGLCEALEDLFEKLEDTEGMDALCEIKGARERLPENKEIMIYRIVQELVNNTLKHANAKKIRLKINVMPAKLDIHFSDDGKGFDVDKMLAQKSIGLQSIFSRVKFLDGTVSIDSGAGKGTVFAMQIPLISDH